MRLLAFLACVTALASLAACGEESEPQLADGAGYTFEVPAGWEDISGSDERTTDLLGELSGSIADLYDVSVVSGEERKSMRTTFSVRVYEDIPPGYDSRRLVDQNMAVFENPDQVNGLLPAGFDIDYADREPRRIELGGETAYQVRYRVTTPRAELKVLQVYAMHDGDGYVATLRAVPAVFDPQRPEFSRMIKTWRWE